MAIHTHERAAVHAALGEPIRLAIVDDLGISDRSPNEIAQRFGLESNLLAHHLDVLEGVGLIERSRSSGDGRRRYVHLRPGSLEGLGPGWRLDVGPALFVCSGNAARSQLAAAIWRDRTGERASSAGTHPADRVHREAVAAAARAGLDLSDAAPRALTDEMVASGLVVTVCDRAHERLEVGNDWLHWSVTDPVPIGTEAAFDATIAELERRVDALVAA